MTRPSRRIVVGSVALFAAIGVVVLLAAPTVPIDRAAQWKKVDEAVNKGLPKTAIQELEPIIARPQGQGLPRSHPRHLKKIALEGNIQGNKPEERITRMKAEIAKAPKEMVPVMDAVLAHWYWHYFQQNRWRFVQRTTTAAAPSEDFTTWDLKRLFAEIDKRSQGGWQPRRNSRAPRSPPTTPCSRAACRTPTGRPSTTSSPSDALQFTRPASRPGQGRGRLRASRPTARHLPRADFSPGQPQTTDADSPKVKAIKLYQDLLNFHKNDQDKSAYLDADLSRLQFAHANAFGETGRPATRPP
jgi:hypothetical protein